MITPVLQGIQQKIEKAQKAQGQNTAAQETAAEDIRTRVKEIGEKTAKSTESFVKTTQDSTTADITLVLETLKGNQAGIALAQAAKEQNDRSVELSEHAVDKAFQAVELAGKATLSTGVTH